MDEAGKTRASAMGGLRKSLQVSADANFLPNGALVWPEGDTIPETTQAQNL